MHALHEPEGCTAETFSMRLLAEHGRDRSPAVLTVRGEVDLGSAPALREALLPVLERQAGRVVVDLYEVAFMDSAGVHVLVDTLERLSLQHRSLAIVCREGGPVHRVLALLGLLDALTVHRSRESAMIGGDEVLRPEPEPGRRSFAAQTPAWSASSV